MVVGLIGSILAEIILIILIFLVLYPVFTLGRAMLGLLINIVLGFVSIVVLNALFGLGIPWNDDTVSEYGW